MSFYDKHLNRVSRSFAICIAALEQPLRDWVSLTYLFCRVVDTIEDAQWINVDDQLRSYQLFESLLHNKGQCTVAEWRQGLPTGVSAGEFELICEFEYLLSELNELPQECQVVVRRLVQTMLSGMRHYTILKQKAQNRFNSVIEINQYCFFVAGIVGEALTQLLQIYNKGEKFEQKFFVNAHHFGLFLQKINMLKDQKQDEIEGRFFISSRESFLRSMIINSRGAMDYILDIPLKNIGYRIFCLWSFFLGLKTLPQLVFLGEASANENKLPREETILLFQELRSIAQDNYKITQLYQSLLGVIQSSTGLNFKSNSAADFIMAASSEDPATWFLSTYEGGLLSNENLQQLQLL